MISGNRLYACIYAPYRDLHGNCLLAGRPPILAPFYWHYHNMLTLIQGINAHRTLASPGVHVASCFNPVFCHSVSHIILKFDPVFLFLLLLFYSVPRRFIPSDCLAIPSPGQLQLIVDHYSRPRTLQIGRIRRDEVMYSKPTSCGLSACAWFYALKTLTSGKHIP